VSHIAAIKSHFSASLFVAPVTAIMAAVHCSSASNKTFTVQQYIFSTVWHSSELFYMYVHIVLNLLHCAKPTEMQPLMAEIIRQYYKSKTDQ